MVSERFPCYDTHNKSHRTSQPEEQFYKLTDIPGLYLHILPMWH